MRISKVLQSSEKCCNLVYYNVSSKLVWSEARPMNDAVLWLSHLLPKSSIERQVTRPEVSRVFIEYESRSKRRGSLFIGCVSAYISWQSVVISHINTTPSSPLLPPTFLTGRGSKREVHDVSRNPKGRRLTRKETCHDRTEKQNCRKYKRTFFIQNIRTSNLWLCGGCSKNRK